MFDARGNERYEYPDSKVEYTLGHFSDDETFEADLINANETGLCMLSQHRFIVGQEITLKNVMGYSSRTAVVIWIVEDEGGGGFRKSDQVLFRVGLQFED